jgi:hypothetical protein
LLLGGLLSRRRRHFAVAIRGSHSSSKGREAHPFTGDEVVDT